MKFRELKKLIESYKKSSKQKFLPSSEEIEKVPELDRICINLVQDLAHIAVLYGVLQGTPKDSEKYNEYLLKATSYYDRILAGQKVISRLRKKAKNIK